MLSLNHGTEINMLILSRKINESIVIDGKIIIKILRIEKDTVKLGIQAPPEVSVHRQEIQDLIERGHQNGAKANHAPASRANAGPKTTEYGVPSSRVTPSGSE